MLCGHDFRPLTCHPVIVLGFLQRLRWEIIFERRAFPDRKAITIQTQPAKMLIRMFRQSLVGLSVPMGMIFKVVFIFFDFLVT